LLSGAELFVDAAPFHLTGIATLPNGAFQFSFTNTSGVSFSALGATNPALSLSNWVILGSVTEVSPGQYQFTELEATNSAQRFYRVKSN
jgi:predicted metal-binding membrane protein